MKNGCTEDNYLEIQDAINAVTDFMNKENRSFMIIMTMRLNNT